jgi:hypothetical protein
MLNTTDLGQTDEAPDCSNEVKVSRATDANLTEGRQVNWFADCKLVGHPRYHRTEA